MQGSVLYGPGDVRVEERPDPMIIEPTDAIIRLAATCVCGSDLWPYRGVETFGRPTPMCHEYCGIVEEVGREVSSPVSSSSARFSPRINLPIYQAGYQASYVNRQPGQQQAHKHLSCAFHSPTARWSRCRNCQGTLWS